MLVGYPPFFDDNPFGIYEKILAGKIEWNRFIDPIAKDLIKKLLVQDRTKRLGNMKVNIASLAVIFFVLEVELLLHCCEILQNGAEDVKRHRWFKHVDWKDVYHKRLKVCTYLNV